MIEATRTFNDLSAFHHLDSHGVVDRDRRDANEVGYLRQRKVFVPEVAEIEKHTYVGKTLYAPWQKTTTVILTKYSNL